MNDETITLERTDEDILTYTVSDDALEAAASSLGGITPNFSPSVMPPAPNTPNAAGEFPVPDPTFVSGKAAAWSH